MKQLPKILTKPMVLALLGSFLNNHSEAQSTNRNYVVTYSPRVAITNASTLPTATVANVNQAVQYFDGLGRPIQTVQTKGSPTQRDVVQPMAYDQYDRQSVAYLPYVDSATSSNYGTYKVTAIPSQAAFYANPTNATWNAPGVVSTPYPLSSTRFEQSPLNRTLEQGFSGDNWQLSGTSGATSPGHTAKTAYACNNSTSLTTGSGFWLRNYTVSFNYVTGQYNFTNTLVDNGGYPANTVYLTVSKNENWSSSQSDSTLNTTQTYADKFGQILLKRTFNFNTSTSTREILSTYYVYDEYSRLSYVIPPSANPDSGAVSQRKLDNLCYQYVYDGRGRVVKKKFPGRGWEIIIYNKLNQIIGEQDSTNRMAHPQRVMFTKYDSQARAIENGYYTIPGTSGLNYWSTLQAKADSASIFWETKSSSGTYSNATIPTSNAIVLITNYYDDYNVSTLPSTYIVSSGVSSMTKGLSTATTTAVINQTADNLWSVHYYDDYGRQKKTYAQHYLGGHNNLLSTNYDLTTYYYNFVDQLDTVTRQHYKSGSQKVLITTISTYDHIGRPLTTTQQITGNNGVLQSTVILSSKVYNQVGQLYSDSQNGALQTIRFGYNERGWKTSITPLVTSSFGGTYADTISYNNPTGTATKQYNGNISQFRYNGPHMNSVNNSYPVGTMNAVNYTYDNLNRLTQSQSSLPLVKSDETITYDLNGNIKTLARTGKYAGARTYSYPGQSNQVQSVRYGALTARTYTYDGNGNTTQDSSQNIHYNIVNLPDTIKNGSTISSKYYYSASGLKLRNIGTLAGTVDYIDGIVYSNGKITYIQNSEGRNYLSGDSINYNYEYDLTDYLGNVRASFDNSGTGGTLNYVQENDYYPFGLSTLYYDNSNGNHYLSNGKELQSDLSNKYDYGGRFYDALIARWTSVDPSSEKYFSYSNYVYDTANPILFVDPDGKAVVAVDGGYEFTEEDAVSAFEVYKNKHANIYIDITRDNMLINNFNNPAEREISMDGQWQTFAGKNLYDVVNALNMLGHFSNFSIDNLIISTHGGFGPAGADIKINDDYDGDTRNSSFISNTDLKVANGDVPGANLTNNADRAPKLAALKELAAKVKDNGNLIFASCNAGAGQLGADFGQSLNEFTDNRLNIFLGEVFFQPHYDKDLVTNQRFPLFSNMFHEKFLQTTPSGKQFNTKIQLSATEGQQPVTITRDK